MGAENISVIKVRDVLLVTVPADPDDETISALQDQVLRALDGSQAKGLILDISTVETLDSFFARTVVETTQMVALMGGRTVIAGIRPSVAITATQLGFGFTLNNTLTALNVDRALDMLKSSEAERSGP